MERTIRKNGKEICIISLRKKWRTLLLGWIKLEEIEKSSKEKQNNIKISSWSHKLEKRVEKNPKIVGKRKQKFMNYIYNYIFINGIYSNYQMY